MAEKITFGQRFASFLGGTVDTGFGIEMGYLAANFFFGAFALANLGFGGLAVASLLLSIAPARALVREFTKAGTHFKEMTRRPGSGGGHH